VKSGSGEVWNVWSLTSKRVLKVWCLGTVTNVALYFPQKLYGRYAI